MKIKKKLNIIFHVIYAISFVYLLYLLQNVKQRIIGGIILFILTLSVIYIQALKYGQKEIPEDEFPMSRHYFSSIFESSDN